MCATKSVEIRTAAENQPTKRIMIALEKKKKNSFTLQTMIK